MNEVGRGALAGPVSVGLAIVGAATPDAFPRGLADSKQLSPARREALVEPCRAWLIDSAVAHAQPTEIDALGIVGALRLAGQRALAISLPFPSIFLLLSLKYVLHQLFHNLQNQLLLLEYPTTIFPFPSSPH